MRAGARKKIALASAGALAVGLVSVASAQDRLGGKTLVVTLGQTLRYSDNIDLVSDPDGSVLQSRTSLDFAFDSVTRTQKLSLDAGGLYDIDTDGRTDVTDPYLNFSYALEGANSRLSLASRFRRIDLNDTINTFVIPIDPVTGGALDPVVETAVIESGVRTDIFNSLRFETGLRSNVGFVLDLSERARRFTDTTSTNLFDSRTRRASGIVTFRIDPQISARLTAGVTRYDAEDVDQTERRERSIGAGVTLAVNPTLDLNAGLRHVRIERDELGGNSVTNGMAYDLGLTQDLRNGAITVNFDSQPTLNGHRSTLRANRAMSLRRDGTLSYGLGVTKTSGLSAEPLFALAYTQPLKRGRFGMSFSQEARTDELDEQAVILSRLSANYAMPLTSTVNWSLGLSVSDVAAREDTGEDRRQLSLRSDLTGVISDVSSWSAGITLNDTKTASLGATENQRRYGIEVGYRHKMTRDWDMTARYSHIAIDETGTADRSSNTISIGVERSFSFRP